MASVTARRAFDILAPKINDFSGFAPFSIGTESDTAHIQFPYRTSCTFFGSGFNFDAFAGTDTWRGKVDHIEVGTQWVSLVDLHLDLAIIGDLLAAENPRGFWSYVFRGDDHIEGSKGNDHFDGFAGADVLHGGAGNDQLDGGTGTDTLLGGEGNDRYFIDDSGEIPRDSLDSGTDTVYSRVSYVLGPQQENLHLTGSKPLHGTGNRYANLLVGNDAANVLVGGDGNDRLDGRGGADHLVGGSGRDIYVVDHPGEISRSLADPGIDNVQSSVSYTLGPYQEHLALRGVQDLAAIGNAHANTITGNDGNNHIDGRGGADRLMGLAGDDILIGGVGNDTLDGGTGLDILSGGAGRDLYVLHAGPAAADIDVIRDFEGAGPVSFDLISLDHKALDSSLAVGVLAADVFESGAGLSAATTTAGRVIYDTTSGALYYDGDGVGGTYLVLHIATLQSAPSALDATDFVVV